MQSLRKQTLLAEFATLRRACPAGILLAFAPGNVALWDGVIFVRKGPYAPAVLRLQISFPDDYPILPPIISFISDIFHPLVTPQTTYTYTTGALDTETVSATDDERLPPGGFSLRHGFPHWFERGRESASSSRRVSESVPQLQARSPRYSAVESKLNRLLSPSRVPPGGRGYSGASEDGSYTPIVEVLEYLKSALTDEAILDSIPLEAAANSGAYHAWRSHRAEPSLTRRSFSPQVPSPGSRSGSRERTGLLGGRSSDLPVASKARLPGEWNWTGVWEERVKKGTQNSLSEPALFGNATGSIDMIRFFDMDEDALEEVKERMIGGLKTATTNPGP